LQALLMTCNYAVEPHLRKSHMIVPMLIDRSFAIHKDILKQKLQNTASKVHFTIDKWTSPNKKAFLSVCVHFVDGETFKLQKALLSLPQLRYGHGGKLQSKHIIDVIEEYSLTHKVGYF